MIYNIYKFQENQRPKNYFTFHFTSRLGTFRGLCTERARLGTFGGLNLNKTPFKRLGYTEKNFEIFTQNEHLPAQRFFF